MHWFTPISRILLVVMAGAGVGWYYGNTLAGASVAAGAVLLFWSRQIWLLERWLRDTSRPPPDLHGIWGAIVSHVHKQRREANAAQERLQSTVDYLLDSFAAMRDGVVIVESGGAIRWCNEAGQLLLGLRYPDDVGQAITNLVREPAFIRYLDAREYAEPLVFEAGGSTKSFLQLIVTRFAGGDTLLFIRDVSDRVRTEQMRRDFVSNVSHELRTPLTVISGYLDTILGDSSALPAPYSNALQQMAVQSHRMESLLKDLLWLSRIETAERREKNEWVDMAALLEELQQEVSTIYPDRPFRLDVQCTQRVKGDYRELYSAVSNLVLNAFKYSPRGGEVFASWRKEGEDYRLDVRDRGIGIDPAHFPRLTERFYRVEDSRASATGGTGLGLAIVKHVAASHRAELKVESRLGEGSTFSLVFPAQS
ncbi:phosphate regulon sensor histidine kinase PhoR [Seongchinamella sediminis]|uniref:Phosphate regulon sensor protein PhoR n=1 Tax=Seongchinamella sediminis TaxID=2283635 RepID=A0A3L7E3H0_9GAMM|nr:phosphate regulon sensor histidine kinase PhoR [Seongchinamella sediminis]RLQ23003.1 phosphate regulon sensor histidine kinase PhoR [Seongchinamella sediminis]